MLSKHLTTAQQLYSSGIIFLLVLILDLPMAMANSLRCSQLFFQENGIGAQVAYRLLEIANEQNILREISQKQESWRSTRFSNPARHDANNYIYLVHALANTHKHLSDPYERVNILEHPDLFWRSPILSASVITKEKSMTFVNEVGLILKVPASNVIATREVDMQSSRFRKPIWSLEPTDAAQKLLMAYRKFGLDSPSELLKKTYSDFYNEVLVLGFGPTGEKVEVVGYYTITINGQDTGQKLGLIELAQRHHLPLVNIEIPSGVNFDRLTTYPEFGQ